MSLFTVYVSGQAAADLGYVNPGTDRRLGGKLGRKLGATQSLLSFKSPCPPPERHVERVGDALVEVTAIRVGGVLHPHISVAVPRGNGRWATFRAGWRWDPNWGNATTLGWNPMPHVVGGYIADVVIKLDSDKSFIEVEEIQ